MRSSVGSTAACSRNFAICIVLQLILRHHSTRHDWNDKSYRRIQDENVGGSRFVLFSQSSRFRFIHDGITHARGTLELEGGHRLVLMTSHLIMMPVCCETDNLLRLDLFLWRWYPDPSNPGA